MNKNIQKELQRGHAKVSKEYTKNTKQKEQNKETAPSFFHFKPNQSTKQRDIAISFIQCLTHSKKLHIKKDLSIIIKSPSILFPPSCPK